MNESKTPRTDAALSKVLSTGVEIHWGDGKAKTIADFARQLERKLDAWDVIRQRNLETDSIVGSCGCGTKTPDVQHHKAGCKYRLISERDTALDRVKELEKFAAFSKSCILSGESWSESAQSLYGTAMQKEKEPT